MKIAYQYLFYKLYSYMLRTPNRQNALDGTVALISIIDLFFVIDLFMIFSKCISYIKSISDNTLIICGLIIAFLIYLINTKYFKKSILEIKEKFDQENNIQKWIGRIFVLIVGIGSIGSLIAIGLLFK
ncbi:hypothetical protein [uncultured Bacteroides sp.]|uniref:hypothetical protein n=1 Tax=uncultured Bacteroides sp. TaxID=162156 RepID=UPI002AA889D4|nr:hypothetical protein [uncultured Bacteroides sp.]